MIKKPVVRFYKEEDLKTVTTMKLKKGGVKNEKNRQIKFLTVFKLNILLLLLQLHLPWQDKHQLKDYCQSYEEQYVELNHTIKISDNMNHLLLLIMIKQLIFVILMDIDESDDDIESIGFHMVKQNCCFRWRYE